MSIGRNGEIQLT